jgi:hypothetical protein
MSSMLSPDKPPGRFLELSAEEWAFLALGSATFVAILASLWSAITFWSAAGLMFTAIVLGHLCMTTRRFVAFPDLVAAAACLQWIVAPLLAEEYPPTLTAFRMALPPADYLRYAVPATIALWVGLHLPVGRRLAKTWTMPRIEFLSMRAQRVLDAAIVLGLIVDSYTVSVGATFGFLLYLVASLRFAGALGWMITRTPGWGIRAAIVLTHLAATQSSSGAFYLVVHWGGYFLLVYAFMRRWRWRVAATLAAGLIGLALLQDVKPTFRHALNSSEIEGPVESVNRLVALMWERVSAGRLTAEDTYFGDLLVRFNQGWIIARIMTHVPKEEPYAHGQTLVDAALFSVMPRFLFPEKREGASQELFRKYTGVELQRSTRMGLGIIGEMYANFGAVGGVAATFAYGLLMGVVFLWFADRAQKNPLWWAAASTVLLPGVEPGFNLEDIANHVVKAAIIFFVLWKTLPPVEHILASHSEDDAAPDEDAYDSDEDAGDLYPVDDAIADHRVQP